MHIKPVAMLDVHNYNTYPIQNVRAVHNCHLVLNIEVFPMKFSSKIKSPPPPKKKKKKKKKKRLP